MGKTISVLSLKGGVGKTSSIIALADAIAEFGKKVLLIDGNFSAPNLGFHFNIIHPESTLHDLFRKTGNIDNLVHKLDNFDFLPADLFNRDKINPLELKDKISSLKKKYDYVLVDSSPSLNDEALSTMLASDKLLVVTTPDLPTLGVTLKAIKIAKTNGVPITGLILNKVYDKNFEIPLKNIEEVSGFPVMAVIPHDTNFQKAVSKFKSIISFKPNSEASIEFKKLAGMLIGEKYESGRLKDIWNDYFPNQQTINREVYYSRVFKD